MFANFVKFHLLAKICQISQTSLDLAEFWLYNLNNELVGERAKRARHSQVCSIENHDNSTYVHMSRLPFDL